jgi:hypothetical protein
MDLIMETLLRSLEELVPYHRSEVGQSATTSVEVTRHAS